MSKKPILLLILDGFGISLETKGNAIALAKKPNFTDIGRNFPGTALQAAGLSVGIPWGEVGNSEVGHTTLGAGVIVYQNLPRINLAIENGSFFRMPLWQEAIAHAQKNKSAIHLMGIFSNSGVHGHIDHLFALLKIIADSKTSATVYFHLFTDGRDSPPNSAPIFLKMLEEKIKEYGIGVVATVTGRYYAMDRNRNWDRTQKCYQILVDGQGKKFTSAGEAISDAYAKGFTDEFIEPSAITDGNGKAIGAIGDNDAVIFYNFRPDRARQLMDALVNSEFKGFARKKLANPFFATMTEYDPKFSGTVRVAFPPEPIANPLARILAEHGKIQLHIAETEKYAHITYFFNGGREAPFSGEDRVLIPSPTVAHFDAKPEMSIYEITETLLKKVDEAKHDFIVANFANADMVGHTGNLEAGIKAVEAIDTSIGKLYKKILDRDGVMLITADHGNAEEMINLQTKQIDTEHSTNPVPFWIIGNQFKGKTPKTKNGQLIISGSLADVAPTILDLMDIPKPKDFVGESLIGKITRVEI